MSKVKVAYEATNGDSATVIGDLISSPDETDSFIVNVGGHPFTVPFGKRTGIEVVRELSKGVPVDPTSPETTEEQS